MVKSSTFLLLVGAAIATVFAAEEPSNCKVPAVRHNVTAIQDKDNFCLMWPPKGIQEVAPSEACATSMCVGNPKGAGKDAAKDDVLIKANERFPEGVILSSHYIRNDTGLGYTQITGCMDGAKWGLNPLDGGGQMDSHGWQYRCSGHGKFLNLVEPSTNTYCIRCCGGGDKDPNCNTGISTAGCWRLMGGGEYSLNDGSPCPPPAGAPVDPNNPGSGTGTPGSGTGGSTDPNNPGTGAPGTGAGGNGGTGAPGTGAPGTGAGVNPPAGANPTATTTTAAGAKPSSSTTPNKDTLGSSGARSMVSKEVLGMAVAGALALAAAF